MLIIKGKEGNTKRVGVALDFASGKSSGSFGGEQYFKCGVAIFIINKG
jgi:dynactin complex subunit